MGIERAIKKGGLSALARRLGEAPQTVSNWRMPGRQVPENRCPEIEAFTGVPREELRPDVDWTKYDRPCPHCGLKANINRVSRALRRRDKRETN